MAANVLADRGWEVQVLEAQPEPGGAVRSDRGVHPDFVSDLCSAFYPLAVASPAIRALELERFGLGWRQAPAVLAHPLPDGPVACCSRDSRDGRIERRFGHRDGAAWERLSGLWHRIVTHLIDALFTPFPPVRAGAAMAGRCGPPAAFGWPGSWRCRCGGWPRRSSSDPAAGCCWPAVRCTLICFRVGRAARRFGWLLAMLGQHFGWPVPVGGASALTAALVRRLEALGGSVPMRHAVAQVLVRDGQGGRRPHRRRQSSTRPPRRSWPTSPATSLYGDLISWDQLPARARADCAGSSGTSRRSRSTGRCTAPSPGPHRPPRRRHRPSGRQPERDQRLRAQVAATAARPPRSPCSAR